MPVTTVEATAMVMMEVPEPGAAIELGLKVTVTPVGWPVADNAIAELKPPEIVVVMVEVPEVPCAMDTEFGEAETLKPGVEDPVSAAISPLFGLPHPVTRS